MFILKCWRKDFAGLTAIFVLSTLCFLGDSLFAATADYPVRPIYINSASPPGAAAGISGQIFSEGVKKYLPNPQPIVINYKPGAAGAIGAEYVLKQPLDGYNLYWASPDFLVKLAREAQMLHFTKEDFIFLGGFAANLHMLIVKKDAPFKTLADYIDQAKKNPGKVSYSTSGVGGVTHLTAEIFQRRAGIRLNNIPFSGGAEAMAACLGGHVDSNFGTPATAGDNIKPGGGLRVLAIFSNERSPEFPDVPTALEKGYNVDHSSFYFLAAPKGIPKTALDVLLTVCKKAADDPEVKATLSRAGYTPLNWDSREMQKRANEEMEFAKEFFKDLK